MKYFCWITASILAALKLAGIATQISWWVIVGLAVAPAVFTLLLLAILLFAVK